MPEIVNIVTKVADVMIVAGQKGDKSADSVVPGPTGADSVVPGPVGSVGPGGADSVVPGPAGANSTVPGPIGPVDPAGADSVVPGPVDLLALLALALDWSLAQLLVLQLTWIKMATET